MTKSSKRLFSRRHILLASVSSYFAACDFGLGKFATLPELLAAPFEYNLKPIKIATDTYVIIGKLEYFNSENGGDIVNIAFIDTEEGVVLIDTGPSLRYGEALKSVIWKVTGKEVIRVYNTHFHPDHCLGNQVFEASRIAAMPQMIAELKLHGDAFSDNLYRLLGDWMRGTQIVLPGTQIKQSSEKFGSHRLELLPLKGHTSSDLAILDHKTGILFAGDLAFLDRAATTPHATIPEWQKAITELQNMPHNILVPGHGPVDRNGEALAQTSHYIGWLERRLEKSVREGDDMIAASEIEVPEEFQKIALLKEEYERSIAHLYPALEEKIFPLMKSE